jgi:aspartate racemase
MRFPIPALNILDVTAAACANRSLRKVAILGTRTTMDERLYDAPLDYYRIEAVYPDEADRDLLQDRIYNELIPNACATPETKATLEGIVHRLSRLGCDGAILGCTELPLAYEIEPPGITYVDSTKELALAAVQEALTSDGPSRSHPPHDVPFR